MKGAWNTNISEVCLKSHAPRNMGPSSGRDLCGGMGRWIHSAVAEILTGKSFCRDSGGKLSEIFNGYRGGRVPCYPLQGHHLLKMTGETAGCCQQALLVERQGTRHRYAIRYPCLKSFPLSTPDRQTYGACWRLKPLWNTPAITVYVVIKTLYFVNKFCAHQLSKTVQNNQFLDINSLEWIKLEAWNNYT